MSSYVKMLDEENYIPHSNEYVNESLFKKYEKVLMETIITSFCLDFFIKDQHGGNVDTPHTVREIGKDPNMVFKNDLYKKEYENRGAYNSGAVHGHKNYRAKRAEINSSEMTKDAYTGKNLSRSQVDLDHVISGKSIHDDPARILARRSTEEVANKGYNLKPTSSNINRSKGADSMTDYLKRTGDKHTAKEKEKMIKVYKDTKAKMDYDMTVDYLRTNTFKNDMIKSSAKVGFEMAFRQVVGVIFLEVWDAVKIEFNKTTEITKNVFEKIVGVIKTTIENVKVKYKEIVSSFGEGFMSGVISNISTTICNFFFTTGKNIVKIIRESWVSITKAVKILFINPDNLPYGDRLKEASKVIAVGASVVIGSVIGEFIHKSPIGQIPYIGGIISNFLATFATGIISCTLLHIIDNSKLVKKLVEFFNRGRRENRNLELLRQQTKEFEAYAARLMEIDLETFEKDVRKFDIIATKIENAKSDYELNIVLNEVYKQNGWKLPYVGDFDSFMNDKNARLVFE